MSWITAIPALTLRGVLASSSPDQETHTVRGPAVRRWPPVRDILGFLFLASAIVMFFLMSGKS